MALISDFVQGSMERMRLHDRIEATYFFHEYDGRKLLQINTSGRKTRDIPGKTSQSIQLDERGAKELFEILRTHFGFK